jgi:cytoskeleton protein RodZ
MQTIGERLEEARKKKGISIREAAEATKIRGDYLQKFESNHFDIGLTEIYTRGFLRTYANFLKVPADRLLNDYAALGRGDTRPRQPSREVYGRMDISVATAGESSERAAPPADEPVAAETQRPQPRYPRGSSSLPSGPDPAVIFKYVKWAVVVVVLLLLGLAVKSFFSGPSSPRSSTTTPPISAATPAPRERYITLVPQNTVTVRVLRRNPDDSEGAELFNGTLSRDQNTQVPWPLPTGTTKETIFIYANPGQNLMIEIDGKLWPTGITTSKQRAKL